MSKDQRVTWGAAERNRVPIAEALAPFIAEHSPRTVLEVASGTGQHVAHFSDVFSKVLWQPSDPNLEAHESIRAWSLHKSNVLPPLSIDATRNDWPGKLPIKPDWIYCANMIHIAPIEAMHGLMKGAAELLKPGALLFLYGPFFIDGEPRVESNVRFDESLRERDGRWGVRNLNAVDSAAIGFTRDSAIALPANNHLVVYVRE